MAHMSGRVAIAAYSVVAPPTIIAPRRGDGERCPRYRIHRPDASDTGARWHIRNRAKRKVSNAIATDSGAP